MPYDTEVLADAPIVYWRLDDATTTATDSSGNTITGTPAGAGITALQTGLINDGTSFDFNSDNLVSSSEALLQLDLDFTFEWWVQFDSGDPPSGQMLPMSLLGVGNRAVTMEDTLDQIDVTDFNGNSAVLTFTALSLDTPYHIVVTYDDSSGAVEVFIDGVSVDTGTVAGPGLDPQGSASTLTFGSGLLSADHWLGDEAAVYDTVLSSVRIGVHYAEGAGGGGTPTYEQEVMADTPELYWRLDETTTTTAIDTSGNGHTGTTTTSGGGTATALIDGLISQGTAWEVSDAGATPSAYVASGTSSALVPSVDWTFELWVRFDDLPANSVSLLTVDDTVRERAVTIFDTLDEFFVGDSNGDGVNLTFATALSLGVPHHIVITYVDSTEVVEAWVDGVSVDSGVVTPSSFDPFTTPASTRFFIGGEFSGPNGELVYDEVAYYLTALADARIEAHYEAGFLFYNDAALLGVARQSTTGGVFLSQPGEQIAEIQAQLLDIDDMDAVVVQLDQAVDYTWQDPFSEPGAGRIELMNDDPDLPLIVAQSLVRFDYKGWAAFTMICEQYARTSVSQDEESGQSTIWEGRGHLALLERGLVYPTGGPNRVPIAEDRGFNWSSPEFDDGAWTTATAMSTAAAAKITWGGGADTAIDANWPDDTALMIWASSGTSVNAPAGTCFFRKTVTLATTGKYIVYWLTDNGGSLYIDGLHLQDSNRFTGMSTALVELSAGVHTFAVLVTNAIQATTNPGALLFALYTAGGADQPIDFIMHSDTTWLILEYPPGAPGMTPGEVMRICVDEMQARGVLPGVVLTFTDENDTAGDPWPEVADIATKVGTDVLTFFRELAGTYVDIWMEPGALNLSAWNYGTRGQVRPVTIESPTDVNDPDSGNLTALIHRGTG